MLNNEIDLLEFGRRDWIVTTDDTYFPLLQWIYLAPCPRIDTRRRELARSSQLQLNGGRFKISIRLASTSERSIVIVWLLTW